MQEKALLLSQDCLLIVNEAVVAAGVDFLAALVVAIADFVAVVSTAVFGAVVVDAVVTVIIILSVVVVVPLKCCCYWISV